VPTPAYIPQFGTEFFQGTTYDMAVSEVITHNNEFTRHPIEDPSRSFIYDHNREEPTELRMTIMVSTTPAYAGGGTVVTGEERIRQFQEKLLARRAAQSTTVGAFFDVFTGLRTYKNMGIQSITFSREVDSPNTMKAEIELVEFRFANPPRSEEKAYLMDGNYAPRNVANDEIVDTGDRPTIEALRERFAPRMLAPTNQLRSVVRSGITSLPLGTRNYLGIDITAGKPSTAQISFLLLDDISAQNYILRIGGVEHNHTFQYNPLRNGFWSVGFSLVGADCPRIAGRRLEHGVNLYDGLSTTEMLIPIRRPDLSVAGEDSYRQFVRPLSDGAPAFSLVLGTRAAFSNLFYNPQKIVC
jgi:hypothetical protein